MAKKVVIRKTRKRYVVRGVKHRLKKAAMKDVSRRIGKVKAKTRQRRRKGKRQRAIMGMRSIFG